MITKRIVFGSIDVHPTGAIQVREDTLIEEDGVLLSKTYHRRVIPADDAAPKETDRRLLAIIKAIRENP